MRRFVKFKKIVGYLFVTPFFLSVLTGCGNSSDTRTKGYLIDSPLQGVTYLCDGNRSGITNDKGMFECLKAPVTFKVGGLIFGILTAFTKDGKVYPQDLLGLDRDNYSNSRLKLLARLLQSLDDNGDIGSKITIVKSMQDAITKEQDFKNMSQSDISSLLDGLGKTFVPECGALKHLGDSSISCDSNGSYSILADTTPPTFTSSPTITVPENQTNALTLQATDVSTPITYSISGGDSTSFNVNSSTGKVTFKMEPDFETKNKYTFVAKAIDVKGNEVTQNVTINISDIDEIVINNLKIILISKKNISAYEYTLEIKDDLLKFPEIKINSTFLTKNGRKSKNLKHIISNNKIRFGAYSTGDEDGVAGKYTIGSFTTKLDIPKIKLYNVQCVDNLAKVVDCAIKITKNEE